MLQQVKPPSILLSSIFNLPEEIPQLSVKDLGDREGLE